MAAVLLPGMKSLSCASIAEMAAKRARESLYSLSVPSKKVYWSPSLLAGLSAAPPAVDVSARALAKTLTMAGKARAAKRRMSASDEPAGNGTLGIPSGSRSASEA